MDPVAERLVSSRAALRWLTRMRWHAAGGAAIAVAIADLGLDLALPVLPLALVIAAIAGSNLLLGRLRTTAPESLVLVIAIDAVLLTLLLAWSGGPANPFAILYLLLVTLAAQLAGLRGSLAVLGVAAVGYAALFAWHLPVPALAALQPYGLAAALAIGACAHAFSVGRLAAALRAHQAELDAVRGRVARVETLAAVGTLAVGAAHELGTPLGAIAIAASDLEHLLARGDADGEAVDEARGIRDEVDRCRAIVDRMAARAGVTVGEVPAVTTMAAILSSLGAALEPDEAARLQTRVDGDRPFRCAAHGLVQVLVHLVRNAVQASEPGAAVALTVVVADAAVVRVEDTGHGIPDAVRAHLGEPFATGRPGAGMGLGVYLARTFAELWGGRLTLEARPGGGTVAILTLPEAARG